MQDAVNARPDADHTDQHQQDQANTAGSKPNASPDATFPAKAPQRPGSSVTPSDTDTKGACRTDIPGRREPANPNNAGQYDVQGTADNDSDHEAGDKSEGVPKRMD